MQPPIPDSLASEQTLSPNPNYFLANIEKKSHQSFINQVYAFPRFVLTESSTNSSVESLEEATTYNLYSQNVGQYQSQVNHLSGSQTEESGSHSTEGTTTFNGPQKDLARNNFSSSENEEFLSSNRPISKTQETAKGNFFTPQKNEKVLHFKTLPKTESVKKTKQRDGISPSNMVKSTGKKNSLGKTKEESKKFSMFVPREAKNPKQIREFTKFSKELGSLMKGKTFNGESEKNVKIEIQQQEEVQLTNENDTEETVRLVTIPSVIDRKLNDSKPSENALQNLQKVLNLEENKEKGRRRVLSTSNKINLYACYKSSSKSRKEIKKPSRSETMNTLPNKIIRTETEGTDKGSQGYKKIQLAKNKLGYHHTKENTDPKEKASQLSTIEVVLREKTIEKVNLKDGDKGKEMKEKAGSERKSLVNPLQLKTLKDLTKLEETHKKTQFAYGDLYKTQKSRFQASQSEKKEMIREYVARALDFTKTMPTLKMNEEKEKEKKDSKGGDKEVRGKRNEEKEFLIDGESSGRDENSTARMNELKKRFNLRVITRSVMREHEAKMQRKTLGAKRLTDIRKFF